jgi:hypothetical protein
LKASAAQSDGPVIRDPFAVIPVQPDNVDQRRDSSGMIHLRLRIEPEGLAKKVAEWLRYDYARKIELDEYGTFFYSHVDGQTTLDAIAERLAEKLGVERPEAEEAVILFTKKLMTMNMLALKVPESAQAPGT